MTISDRFLATVCCLDGLLVILDQICLVLEVIFRECRTPLCKIAKGLPSLNFAVVNFACSTLVDPKCITYFAMASYKKKN